MKAMASLAVSEYLRAKFDMDDVVQGALVKVHDQDPEFFFFSVRNRLFSRQER